MRADTSYRVRSPDGRTAAVVRDGSLTVAGHVLGRTWGQDGPWWTPDGRMVIWLYRTGSKINAAGFDVVTGRQRRLTDADTEFDPPQRTLVSFSASDAEFYLQYADGRARQVKVPLGFTAEPR